MPGRKKDITAKSGNEKEDFENSNYDSPIVPADTKLLADLTWKIKALKRKSCQRSILLFVHCVLSTC
jgi:hypothetical protein